jgi:hypothetical protein
MTTLALTLPLARSSPLRMSRRDFVVDADDDLTLTLAIVADDSPAAAAVSLAAANTAVEMMLWSGSAAWDYGGLYLAPGRFYARSVVHTVEGTITDAAGGLVSLVLARDAGDLWAQRLGYTLQLDLGGTARSTLAWGALHMPRVYA